MRTVSIALLAVLLVSCAVEYEQNPLKAHVQADNTRLVVTNQDGADWTNVTIEVNDKFKKRVDALSSGGNGSTFALIEFAADDGTRFNPFSMKVRRVRIDATVNGRRASYGGEWK